MPILSQRHRARKTNHRAFLSLLTLEDRTTPATLVWTGDLDSHWGTGVSGFNTNWHTNTFPAAGDDLIFPVAAANRTNTNDLSGLFLNSITIAGTDYVLGGNSITLNSVSDSSTGGANALNVPITANGHARRVGFRRVHLADIGRRDQRGRRANQNRPGTLHWLETRPTPTQARRRCQRAHWNWPSWVPWRRPWPAIFSSLPARPARFSTTNSPTPQTSRSMPAGRSISTVSPTRSPR